MTADSGRVAFTKGDTLGNIDMVPKGRGEKLAGDDEDVDAVQFYASK